MSYKEDEYLQIAEIQHFSFCPRQWAITYMEQQWQENVRTIEGHELHNRAHDDTIKEKRKGTIIVRGMPIASRELGICGTCDIVEFISDKAGISIPSYQGTYRIIPVEYKRGKPKDGEEDILQLTLQAMCLEEMLVVTIPYGYLYYGETKHRCKVVFEKYYRKHVQDLLNKMRDYSDREYTPVMKRHKGCANCSVKDLCLPKLNKCKSVKSYIERRLTE